MRVMLVPLLLGLAACAAQPPSDMLGVSGQIGERPTVAIPSWMPAPSEARAQEVTAGTGPPVETGDVVVMDMDIRVWRDGRKYLDTYTTKQPTSTVLDGKTVAQSWSTALVGARPGSRVTLVAPAPESFGARHMAPANVLPTDNLVLVFDVIGGYPRNASVAGSQSVAPSAGLPGVTVGHGKPPVFAFSGPPPAATRVKVLVPGKGPVVGRGDRIVVQYGAATWGRPRMYDGSYGQGPNGFRLEPGALLPGWLEALEGRRVGDRLLVVTPPHTATITPGGLAQPPGVANVFVFDLLDRRAATG